MEEICIRVWFIMSWWLSCLVQMLTSLFYYSMNNFLGLSSISCSFCSMTRKKSQFVDWMLKKQVLDKLGELSETLRFFSKTCRKTSKICSKSGDIWVQKHERKLSAEIFTEREIEALEWHYHIFFVKTYWLLFSLSTDIFCPPLLT